MVTGSRVLSSISIIHPRAQPLFETVPKAPCDEHPRRKGLAIGISVRCGCRMRRRCSATASMVTAAQEKEQVAGNSS